MKIKTIILADDHRIITDGIQTMLAGSEELGIVGIAQDAETTLSLVKALKPDILITDISMPGMNGILLTSGVKTCSPGTSVIVLTMYTYEDFIYGAIRAGARGVLSKQDTTREVLLEAIARVLNGEEYFSPSISRVVMKTMFENARNSQGPEAALGPVLTQREKEILKLYAEGCTNQEIADKLSISTRTVETHKSNIMQKFNFRSTVEMVKYALRNNLVSF